MLRNRYLRLLLGIVLGGFAGLSFTISVVPTVLQLGNVGSQLELARLLQPMAPWSALLWAAGGLSAARVAAPRPSAVTLGLVGAVSGGLLVSFGPGAAPLPLVFAVIAGAVYGGLGGLILGRVLAPPPPESAS